MLSRANTKKDVLIITGAWNAKVGSQDIPGVIDPGGQNEAGQRLTELCQEHALVIAKPFSNNTRDNSTYGLHQVVNTETRPIILFAAKDEEALYSQQKQDLELSVAQIISSLLQNSGLN